MRAFLAQIERVNPLVNAIVTLRPAAELLAEAAAADRSLAGGTPPGVLHGLPIAIKDLSLTRGLRTTFGSKLYRNFVPTSDELYVERLRRAGAIVIGKTNTPEFGAGSQTFNKVFGATRNPYDLSKTCGGSSGGAGVAVATGMLPFADGGDFAASLRNPGSYCNVIGFRPSTGRVPAYPHPYPWSNLSELGPMARTVSDAAFLLSVQAGPDRRAPTSISEPGSIFLKPLKRSFRKTRIAWSRDLGGLPVEPSVTKALEPHRKTLKGLGCMVEDAEPDFTGATEAFESLRALTWLHRGGGLLKEHRAKLKDTVIWNTEEGFKRSAADIAKAENLRTTIYHRMRVFLEKYDFLVCPVSQLPPFPVDQDYPREIAGVKMTNYLDWMKSCYYITLTTHPAISVPAGFTDDGLPVGIQIVGRYRDDFGVLQFAHAFEQATQVWKRRPPIL
jgi:amidase